MDALEQAKMEMGKACSYRDYGPGHTGVVMQAQAYAAIAQAEQLKRIADAAEWHNKLLEKENELYAAIAANDNGE